MPIARYVGFAEEPAFASTPAPTADIHVDIASATLDAPGGTNMVYGGGLQRSAKTIRPGFYAPAGNIVYAFDIRSIAYLLKWVLGEYEYTAGVPGPENLHEIWGSKDTILPSFCARVGKDVFEHVFHGCVINSLELAIEGEFCQVTAEIISAKDSKGTLIEVTNLLLPTEYPLAFYEVTAKVNNADYSARVKSLTLSINNNSDAEAGRGLGQRHPYRIVSNDRETSLKMDMVFEDTAEIEKYWGGSTGPATTGSTEEPVELTFDAGDGGQMIITLPACQYTSVSTQPTGREEITHSVEARANLDTYTLEDNTVVDTEIGIRIENDATEITAGGYGS